jgi:hypothetical protein
MLPSNISKFFKVSKKGIWTGTNTQKILCGLFTGTKGEKLNFYSSNIDNSPLVPAPPSPK